VASALPRSSDLQRSGAARLPSGVPAQRVQGVSQDAVHVGTAQQQKALALELALEYTSQPAAQCRLRPRELPPTPHLDTILPCTTPPRRKRCTAAPCNSKQLCSQGVLPHGNHARAQR
jgi:hypothetical protein